MEGPNSLVGHMGGKTLIYKHKLFMILISSDTFKLLIFKWINIKVSHVLTIKNLGCGFIFCNGGFCVIHKMK
jgi:hypothetical protein